MENYERILEKISRISNVEKEELERRVEAKRAKLSGLISKEGAAQVIAAELGINFDNEKLKIEELLPGMRKVHTLGKVLNISPVRTFKTKKGDEGKVVNLFIADETSNIRVVLWDTNHIELIEKKMISPGIVIEVSNASMRDNELHLGSFSELKIANDILENVKSEKIFSEKKISELKISDNVRLRAFIVQSFEPRFFYVCPDCKKKANQEEGSFICAEHGKVAAEKRALINVVIDDGSETLRAVAFHDNLSSLGFDDLENAENMIKQREELIGKELLFYGNVRNNKVFNNIEFAVDKIEKINLDELISQLEK